MTAAVTCACGCGRPVVAARRHARYASSTCRSRVTRQGPPATADDLAWTREWLAKNPVSRDLDALGLPPAAEVARLHRASLEVAELRRREADLWELDALESP